VKIKVICWWMTAWSGGDQAVTKVGRKDSESRNISVSYLSTFSVRLLGTVTVSCLEVPLISSFCC